MLVFLKNVHSKFYGKICHNENVFLNKNNSNNIFDNKGKNLHNNKICSHCELFDHIVDICYRKHGFHL